MISDYLHIHQRSTKFDVGVDLGAYSLGLSVNRDVDEVYKSITAKGQAVGNTLSNVFKTGLKDEGIFQVCLNPGGECLKPRHHQHSCLSRSSAQFLQLPRMP